MMEGPSADSGEKREPVGNIDIAVVDSLKVLDPRRPIREADIERALRCSCTTPVRAPSSIGLSRYDALS